MSPAKRDRALSTADCFERMAVDLDRDAAASAPPPNARADPSGYT
jgi:hypothetical protein